MKKLWGYVIAAFTLLAGLFLWERNKRQDSEAKLENADTKKDDAVLAQHQSDLQKELKDSQAASEAEKAKAVTDQELLDFLNKDKK